MAISKALKRSLSPNYPRTKEQHRNSPTPGFTDKKTQKRKVAGDDTRLALKLTLETLLTIGNRAPEAGVLGSAGCGRIPACIKNA